MENNLRRPSVFRIMQCDLFAGIPIIFMLAMMLMYLVIMYFGYIPAIGRHDAITSEDAPFFLNLAIIAGIIGIPLLVWRVKLISNLFEKGDEVKGFITYIGFHRDRGKIKYEYTYQNQKYQAGNSVFKTGRTKYYKQGDEIVLLVDSENPKKAIIKNLYSKE